ncbi:hypothetical protein [Leucobacter sp. NPDC077196]|uniref:hypothetical protein n=1 Tax=Leucobacter sp. NPDC077196 TaxID=3154959 RepID=UPI00343AB560
MSAEVLQIDIEAAQRRAERIRLHATNANEAMQSLQKLVHTARELEDHVTLGFASWTAYITDLFGDEPLRLARDVRRELVAELSDAGMSTRAIAPIVGAGVMTVHDDIAAVRNRTPEPVNADGFTVNPSTGEVLETPLPEVTEHTVTEKVKTVTGLDGKEYKRPEPKPREEKPVLDGNDAIQQNAEQGCLAVGRALDALESLGTERRRTLILNDWWPRASENITPLYTRLFNSTDLRRIAAGINMLATDMEAHNDYE